jgi:hypothetical protein
MRGTGHWQAGGDEAEWMAMRRPSTQSLVVPLLTVAFASTATGRELSIELARASNAHVDARGIHFRLVPAPAGAALTLAIEQLHSATLGLDGRLEWSCTLRRVDERASACEGPVALHSEHGVARAALRVRSERAQLALSLDQGERSITLELPFADGLAPTARLQRVPADWLRAPLALAWRGGDMRSGTIDAQVRWHGDGDIDATFAADGVRAGTFDGSFAAEGLALHGSFATSASAQSRRITTGLQAGGGTLQVGALRVALPATPVDIALDARVGEDGTWAVERFAWRDPDVLAFEARGEFEPAAAAPLRALSVSSAELVFPAVKQRYAATLFAAHGLGGLALDGRLRGSVDIDAGGLRGLALSTDALDVRDPARALAIDAIAGSLDWRASGDGAPTSLAWRKVKAGDVVLGPARSSWRARDGSLELQGALRTALAGGTLVFERTVLRPFADAGMRAATHFRAERLGYENADGTLAAAHVGADGELRVDVDAGEPRFRLDARLQGGEALAGAFYVSLPDKPVAVAADLVMRADRWQVERFTWNDPDVLAFVASGEFAPLATPPLQALRLELDDARLGPALQRYARSWLATHGYGELAAAGRLRGQVELDRAGLRRFAASAEDVTVRDGAGRFTLDGLDGTIDWDVARDRPATSFGWRALELFELPFGPARAGLASRGGTITLAQPLAVDVLGGQLRLERFTAQPRSPRGNRYTASFALGGIDMARLSDVFGWPRFPGKLSGGIPEIEFAGERIEFRGGLDLYAFDGHLGLSGLALERPFGVAPSLSADAHFENLDLEQVTRAFSFGGMSGRLSGTIGGVRLVDWSPVAFDAWLRTDGGGRMSYKAVNDLTAIGGGGGLSANLQTMALKLFDTFGYRRLGIRCILRDDVCAMGGIEPIPVAVVAGGAGESTDGYTIVEGSGLPRITIVGHRRRVDWPTLVRRLVEATRGSGPVIE